MQKIIVFIFLFLSVIASAQNEAAEDTTAQPAITAAGKPNGKIAEMKMNKDGGTLVSTDGNLELIIPSGALSKKTTISIQPVTNMMPNGNGQAYRLEPSGIQFQKPVQLIFHYTDEESADSAQLLMGIAMQDDEGQWFGLKKFTLDTVAKTISGIVHHFCAVCKFDVLKIDPSSARVKVKKMKVLQFLGMEPFPRQTDGPDLTFLNRTARNAIWSVNNIEQGNTVVGTLSYGTADYFRPYNIYYAPASVPDQNPVAVLVKLQTVKYNGINFKDLTLVSNILVYDNAYEVTMISSSKGSAGSVLGISNYKDTGSFVVSLETGKAKIIEKVNKNQTDELGYNGTCTVKLLKAGTGNIHITGVRSIRVIPAASPQANPWIEVMFVLAPIRLSLLQMTCPPPPGKGGGPITKTSSDRGMLAMVPAYPMQVKFEAKEGEQIIYKTGEEGGEIFIKFTVKQLKDD